ncbi:hypothetical protein BDV96DRAFT_581060 [Lophiotrema nucula]|uniref:Uncharacterized protein n=1 Tax=Lophiotrema nucula TaxID=690887 RepID=A0A6A5YZP4_9PLEO|nr:hypothetical protein BDV96DRAFT_581060 [Lophiotrema nucula]
MGDMGWDPAAIVSGYGSSGEGKGIAKLAKLLPWASDKDWQFAEEKEEEEEQQVNDGKSVLVGVEHPIDADYRVKAENGRWIDAHKKDKVEKKEDQLISETTPTIMKLLPQAAVVTSSAHPNTSKATTIKTAKARPRKIPGLGLSKEALMKPSSHLDKPKKDMIIFSAPKSTDKTLPTDEGASKDNDSTTPTSYTNNEIGDLEWAGRGDDRPTFTSTNNEAFKGSATKQHPYWEQNEGQEDPVRLSNPKNATTINRSEMKVAMSELLSDFRAT